MPLGQIGGNGKGSGNSAAQGIGQSQSSNQNALCVAGGDIDSIMQQPQCPKPSK